MRSHRITSLGVGVAALLMASAGSSVAYGGGGAHGGGGGHGGGGHGGGGRYVTVFVPGVGYVAQPDGSSVVMPLELTQERPVNIDGDMTMGDVVAQQIARVIDARVLLEPVSVHGQTVQAGAVLAKVTGLQRGLPTLWCDLKDHFGLIGDRLHVCFSGPRGSQTFDAAWVGEAFHDFLSVGPAVAREPEDLPAPASYRPATADERPTVRLGYKWCDGDGVTASPHFDLVVAVPGQSWMPGLGKGCVFGRWSDAADHSKVSVDGAVMDVSPGSQAKTLHFHFGGSVPTAAVLQRLQATTPPAPAAAPPEEAVMTPEDVQEGKIRGVPSGKSLIVFFRPSGPGMALGFTIHEGEANISKIGNGSYQLFLADPGAHTYQVKSEATDTLRLELEPGEIYYVEEYIATGVLVGRPRLLLSDKETFDRISARMRVSKWTDPAVAAAPAESKGEK